MPLTAYEQTEFIQQKAVVVEQILQHPKFAILFFKVLAHSVRNAERVSHQWNEAIFEDHELLKERYLTLLEHAVTEAAKEKTYTAYSTGKLAKYFGVSITTINNWVKEGRFEGVERSESHKQVRVPEQTLFTSPSGKRYRVSEIVDMWEKENSQADVEMDELLFLTRQLALFEGKYGGEFNKTLGQKVSGEMTPEEETDASTWKYFLKRQQDVFGNS